MTADDISFEDFQAFVRVRDSGRFNMMTQCGGAAAAEGISVDRHIAIAMNFNELMSKYSARLERPSPPEKPKRRKAAASFEPAPSPNCGYAEESFVVQRRIPAVEKSKDWRDLSVDLPSFERALAFVESEKRMRKMSNGPKRVFRIVKKRVEASVLFETAE